MKSEDNLLFIKISNRFHLTGEPEMIEETASCEVILDGEDTGQYAYKRFYS